MKLINGDSLEALRDLPSSSIEALVTDPPYGLGAMTQKQVTECLSAWSAGETWEPSGRGFMGKEWDKWVPPPELWREVLRVLKPGAHGLVFAGSRTQDLMSVSLRLAGFEVRDTLMWLYGSGFPKSHNISKALDKKGNTLKVVGQGRAGKTALGQSSGYNKTYNPHTFDITEPNSEQAKQWEGWGTALKPAYEPCILVRKPLEGTVAQNVLEHGCGGINVDGCRIDMMGEQVRCTDNGVSERTAYSPYTEAQVFHSHEGGRYPANVLLDEASALRLDEQAGRDVSRFFYSGKTSRGEREAGCEDLPQKKAGAMSGGETRPDRPTNHPMRANTHPTVKPIELMRYLVRMVTPRQGTVLDPFMGSGSTGCACALEGVDFVGVEREAEYHRIAEQRIAHWTEQREEPTPDPLKLL